MQQREKFSSRLGFILISAGCAIGLGNVYRFPIITSAYGGAIFVLIYIGFLLLLGLPIMTVELAVGRGSQRSIASSFDVLEKKGQKWHLMKYVGIGGNYLLMMCYTVITGWMLTYFVKYLSGSIMSAHTVEELGNVFGALVSSPAKVILGAYAAILLGLFVCSLGLEKGVERITKVMMLALFVLMIGLAIYACTLSGAGRGLRFYLVPNADNIKHAGIGKVINAAMGQAFFTLSLGIGSIAIFGSYIDKDRRLLGESVTIISLDTFVALMSGLIIFPAYYTYNESMIEGEGGAGFLFTTFSSIFNNMEGGRILGALFFLFMSFAAMSTVIAVFENIMSFWLELTPLKRPVVAAINVGLMLVLVLPAAFSLNLISDFKIFGMAIMDLEDYVVSNLLLPIGSLVYVLFCTSRFGWGWKNYIEEVNMGDRGAKMPGWIRPYVTFALPCIIVIVLLLSVF